MHVSYKSFRGDKSDGFGTRILSEGGRGVLGRGVGLEGQLNMCVETIHFFEGINVTVLEIMHQFIMYILIYRVVSESNRTPNVPQ